jgi:hypothetical protein
MYSRAKAMADAALSRMDGLPVSIASLGLLYCKNDGVVGQDGSGLNLIDMALLPLTPIVGSGTAPLQPQEVMDAAERLAFLAFSDPAMRPMDKHMYVTLPYYPTILQSYHPAVLPPRSNHPTRRLFSYHFLSA